MRKPVFVHPSYDELMAFCRLAQAEAKQNPVDAAFIKSTGADLPAWPSKWRWRGYHWSGLKVGKELVAICVYGLNRSGPYVRVELDYTLANWRHRELGTMLHRHLEQHWSQTGWTRFKTKAGSMGGVRLQIALGHTIWGSTMSGELYIDHPLTRTAPEPKLPHDLDLFSSWKDMAAELISGGRFDLPADMAEEWAKRAVLACGM